MSKTEHPLDAENLWFLESIFAQFKDSPDRVDPAWQSYFLSLNGQRLPEERGSQTRRPSAGTLFRPAAARASVAPSKRDALARLEDAYRAYGHRIARIHPLWDHPTHHPDLDPTRYGLTAAEAAPTAARLQQAYCGHVTAQFMHVENPVVRQWVQERLEAPPAPVPAAAQRRALERITHAEVWESFAQTAFLGLKRFSLEGSESLIALLDAGFVHAAELGITDIVLGMPHRGRLNVLTHIAGKPPHMIFAEMADAAHHPHGDEKYHMGYSSEYETPGRSVHISLCFNPSHLEFVGAVALGRVRARQDRLQSLAVLPLIAHGDAAFAGQGIVQECLNMSQLQGYKTGGTVHVVINNQVGFTTSPNDSRSSHYATDVARTLDVPVFHVNGEDPDSVIRVIQLAIDFRQRFGLDVVVDLVAFRRRGHNESDEPFFTQPMMYQWIAAAPTVRQTYLQQLADHKVLTVAEGEALVQARRHELSTELAQAQRHEPLREPANNSMIKALWGRYVGGDDAATADVDTGATAAVLPELLRLQATWPATFTPHLKVARVLGARREMADGAKPLDWAAAEALAFATLLQEGHPVRLSGQDSGRGTFSHRHAVLHDADNGAHYVPLQHLSDTQARFNAWDSPLSEIGVLGFDFGYSLDSPEALVIWEAQYGDFANGAQVIIDQFIAAAEQKWNRLSGIVLLLPHGYEGGGSEHSSARLERFLNLAACDNLQIINPTTPSQIFHALRRQLLRPLRKPLVVMSPKSLLRHPAVVSPLSEFASGRFRRIIADPDVRPEQAQRLVLCSGKIYYDLVAQRQTQNLMQQVAIVRLEQLYPLDDKAVAAALAGYAPNHTIVWAQEEPINMGAWPYLRYRYGSSLLNRWPLVVAARPASARVACSSASQHKAELAALLDEALVAKV